MKKLLNWLKSLFIKSEVTTMTVTTTVDGVIPDGATIVAPTEPVVTTTETATPAAEVKSGVADFEAALAFVESGVAQLGEAAKDELKELAKKYL